MKIQFGLAALALAMFSGTPAAAVDWPVVNDKPVAQKGKEHSGKAVAAVGEAAASDPAEADRDVEVAAKPAPPPVTLKIAINLTRQRLTVTENGRTKYTWKISSGRTGYLTPTGNYRPQWMARRWRSRKYGNAPMPHSIFFHKGYAIHATYSTGYLGRPASHGCIRLSPRNAKRLYRLVSKHGKASTRISIRGHAKQYRQHYAKRYNNRRLRARYGQVPPGYMYSYRRPPRGAYGYRPRRHRQVYSRY